MGSQPLRRLSSSFLVLSRSSAAESSDYEANANSERSPLLGRAAGSGRALAAVQSGHKERGGSVNNLQGREMQPDQTTLASSRKGGSRVLSDRLFNINDTSDRGHDRSDRRLSHASDLIWGVEEFRPVEVNYEMSLSDEQSSKFPHEKSTSSRFTRDSSNISQNTIQSENDGGYDTA